MNILNDVIGEPPSLERVHLNVTVWLRATVVIGAEGVLGL
jgi:hypothetical protein